MKVELCYIYPAKAGERYTELAWRFLNSYLQFPPMAIHSTTIVLNGGGAADDISPLLKLIPEVSFFVHDNSGWDIGAYQAVSRQSKADLLVCFAASTYFQRAGWLNRMIRAAQLKGSALYGAMGNRGDAGVKVWPHIRTTGFWLAPSLLNSYPRQVLSYEQRYAFEHGSDCLTQMCWKRGLKSWVVTWDGMYEWADWDRIPNGMHRGDQSSLLCGDRLTEPPFYPPKRR